MSSGDVQHLVTDSAIHVAYSHADQRWWAVGREGSYGGDRRRHAAIKIARDAAVTIRRNIVVHARDGSIDYRIKRVHGKPVSQAFQDDVE